MIAWILVAAAGLVAPATAVLASAAVPTRARPGLWQGGTPFIDPMNLHSVWWLSVLPLSLLISMAYKGVRMRRLDRYWQEVSVMTAQLIVGIVAAAAGLHLLLEFIVPRLLA